MLKHVVVVAGALALSILATAMTDGGAIAAPKAKPKCPPGGCWIEIESMPPQVKKSPGLTAKPPTNAAPRHFNGVVNRFSAGPHRQRY